MALAVLSFPNHVEKTALVDEMVWGHRLRDDQTAWLLVLEMLNLAEACHRTGDALADVGVIDLPNARPRLRIRFRNLLFRLNQKAAELGAKVQANLIDSNRAWDEWLKHAENEYEGPGRADYGPLRSRFDDFVQFDRAIDLVRSTAIDGLEGVKKMFSRFIFPMAPEALYWEINLLGPEKKLDHTANSFSRAGTLLHMMLARSSSADLLRSQFSAFFDRDSQARRLVKQLQIDEGDDFRQSPRTYLPYARHPRFDCLGKDFAAIFSLQSPDNDKLMWLVPLAALHLAIYHAEVAGAQILGKSLPLPIICEIVAPKRPSCAKTRSSVFQITGTLPAKP
jgi:hypothetical protein